MTRHTELVRALAEIDGVILEAQSHVEKPDGADLQSRAAKVLDDMERARREVEGELRGGNG